MMYIGKGVTNSATPVLIIPMSLRSAIPQWVALQQSPPPLHRLALNLLQFNAILQYTSGTFLDEATNTISGTFFNEATGPSTNGRIDRVAQPFTSKSASRNYDERSDGHM